MRTSIVSDRVVGQFPISIATSLAIEGGLGIHPDHPMDTKPLLDYSEVWVNVKTLFRNLYNACDRSQLSRIPTEDFVEGLRTDMDHFVTVIRDQTHSRMKVVFYTCDYANMTLHYPYAIIRGDTTELQKAYTNAMRETLKEFFKDLPFPVKVYRNKIEEVSEEKILLLTNYPLDLCSKGLRRRALLESHTGAIKLSHQWYTKYLNGKDLPMIPFNERLMQVFGDPEHFRPMGVNLRKTVIDIAVKYGWSQVTTDEKIRYGINQIKDPLLRDVLKEII